MCCFLLSDTVKQTTVALLVIIGVIVILVMGLSNQINKLRGTSNEQPLPVAIDRNGKQNYQVWSICIVWRGLF